MPPKARARATRKLPTMRLEPRRVAELVADPRNARTHSPRNIETIRGSLRLFGQQKNVVIMPDGVMIAGSGTLQAAREENIEWLDCKIWTGTPEEARAYGIVDNRSGELADWDVPVLVETLDSLPDDMIGEMGWNVDEITHMHDKITDDGGGTGPMLGDMEYRIVIECRDEAQQRDLLERLEAEGLDCRAVMS